jgi:hypothetical protein
MAVAAEDVYGNHGLARMYPALSTNPWLVRYEP